LIKINGGLNPQTQESGARFHGHSPPEFLAWISQIVHRAVADAARRGKAKKRDIGRDVPGSRIFGSLTQGSTPQVCAGRAERAMVLAAAVDRLPPHKRDVVVDRFFEHFSFEEISQRTDKSVKALRVLCCRAL